MSNVRSYPPLFAPFVWTSFSFAMFGGFLLAAYLALQIGYGWWPSESFIELIQLHGHLQLIGWMGLLLIGVSLYVLPRLTSSRVDGHNFHRWIFVTITVGLVLKIVAVTSAILAVGGSALQLYFMSSGMLLEATGIVLYLSTALRSVLNSKSDKNDLKRLGPYFVAMFSGWSVLAVGSAVMSLSVVRSGSLILNPLWNDLLIESFVRLTLIPAVFGFGVKMLPIFLGLRAPLWPVRKVGLFLVVSTYLYLCGKSFRILYPDLAISTYISSFGQLGMAVAILSFVWFLDALLFRVLPERISLKMYRSDAQLQRGRFGDKGEFGRFELFIIAGFAWISVVAILEGVNGIRLFMGLSEFVSATTLRHALLLGGLAHIVLGVSHRLLPNLLGFAQLAPVLTGASFAFMFVSSVLRVFPLLLADFGIGIPIHFFAASGLIGMISISIGFVNICSRKFVT